MNVRLILFEIQKCSTRNSPQIVLKVWEEHPKSLIIFRLGNTFFWNFVSTGGHVTDFWNTTYAGFRECGEITLRSVDALRVILRNFVSSGVMSWISEIHYAGFCECGEITIGSMMLHDLFSSPKKCDFPL